ncbi:MAG: ParB/RepB/Spo0J family partition protein [Patescibacteria group bacterium]|nr:ParB/RepB/Spo0J family partition protein [Patescibacteria group bacterium]MDD5164629.1 ParB/RepB/Spo0J family partition protein [Patescibacteria group bacterium]MDD5534529.1 ParB/RepB/Spo0J family partition protein [Patescibacteria group bacterium]
MSLGRGLGALIPPKTIQKITEETLAETGERVLEIPLEQIEANPDQPRKNFPHQEMEGLINSLREYGIIQPLILTSIGWGKYQIVAGERRFRAAKVLEFKTVPAIIRSVKDSEKFEISLLENIQRQDLNPMERARAYKRLTDEFNLTQEDIARKLGKARTSVANTLRLLTLAEPIQRAIEEEQITEGHAKALLSTEDQEKQKILLKRVLGLNLTVRETEKIVGGKRVRKTVELDSMLLENERELAKILDAKIKIIKKKKGGKIVIETFSQEDLEKIIQKLFKC